jgi:SulP family sulfate permease
MILALAVIIGLSVFLTAAYGVDSVELVGDIADIPRSLPGPVLPDLALILPLLMPAVAVGIIGLVQGAGVGQSYPNLDGKYPDVSRDFSGQGLANIATGFFQGITGGGSMSGTAASVNAGAKSRWANVFAGLLVAVIVLLFVGVVKLVPMTALGGLLVVVGFQNIQSKQIALVWQTGLVARTAMVLTLLATLTMPLQFAILVGVAIAILLHVFQSSNQIEVVQFVPVEAGFPLEQPAPAELPSRELTLLYTYGSLFFAAATTFEKKLPSADGARQAVVIPILRGQPEVGSTFNGVLRRYAAVLQANGGKLMLTGVSPSLRDQPDRTGTTALIGEENLFMVQDQFGAAMNEALTAARTWLEQAKPEPAKPA